MAEAPEQNGVEEDSGPPPPSPIRWRSWPVRDSAVRTALAAAVMLAVGAAVYGVTGRVVLAAVALAALAVACWRFFLPIEYELGETGVGQRLFGRRRRIPWRAIARFELFESGLLLMPDADHSPIAPLQGLYLPWNNHRNEILATVRHYVKRSNSNSKHRAGH
jgi:hypothetical protein